MWPNSEQIICLNIGMTEHLTQVQIPSPVVEALMVHALTTENEEIMGLLFGHTDETRIATVTQIHVLSRTDKRKDRCEVSFEQLTEAQQKAEQVNRTFSFFLLKS